MAVPAPQLPQMAPAHPSLQHPAVLERIEKLKAYAYLQISTGSTEIVLPSRAGITEHMLSSVACYFGRLMGGYCLVVLDPHNEVLRILPPLGAPPFHILLNIPVNAVPAGVATNGTVIGQAAVPGIPVNAVPAGAATNGTGLGQAAAPGIPGVTAGAANPSTTGAAGPPGQLPAPNPAAQPVNSTRAKKPVPATMAAGRRKGKGVPRPQNCWLLFRGSKHGEIVAENPGIHNNEVSVIISGMWKELTESEKNVWKEKAKEVKKKHAEEHPDYVYKPRKSSEIKSRKKRLRADAHLPFLAYDHTPTQAGNEDLAAAVYDHNRANTLLANSVQEMLPSSNYDVISTELTACSNANDCNKNCEDSFELSEWYTPQAMVGPDDSGYLDGSDSTFGPWDPYAEALRMPGFDADLA